ncbi:hypothetical protein BDF20DRAFT_824067 [Mycotypha africana]|uniref:uncharacterized protein n=1 Tax=Mycotypha africana TaxID=64632 RepID=UPI0023016478|nr:uncharacterized protein BDF20DRAFT_824067 [Mycotypha africana]KAI8973818.1 hypothetical protein BDF20DRAFT_824067 [Mycotypha africana]
MPKRKYVLSNWVHNIILNCFHWNSFDLAFFWKSGMGTDICGAFFLLQSNNSMLQPSDFQYATT